MLLPPGVVIVASRTLQLKGGVMVDAGRACVASHVLLGNGVGLVYNFFFPFLSQYVYMHTIYYYN